MATNRGFARIRGTDIESPFGFPLDLIDRAVIITTEEYDADTIREILRIRAREEGISISEEALDELTRIGAKTSLRYAVQLLSLAAQNARVAKREVVSVEDVKRVDKLFMDVGEAAEYLHRYEEKMLKH